MNILCIIDDLQVGGTERGLLRIAQNLPPDVNFTVVAIFGREGLAPSFRECGVEVVELNCSKWRMVAAVLKLLHLSWSREFDAVYGLRMMGRIGAAGIGKLGLARPVWLRWGSHPGAEGERWLPLEHWAIGQAATVVAGCQSIADELRGQYGLRQHIWISPPPMPEVDRQINTERMRVRENLNIPPSNVLLGTVANLNWRKDYPTAIRAMNLVNRQISGFNYIIIGDGKEHEKLQTMVRNMDLEDRIHFLGHRDDVPDLLAAMDIFVMTSVNEGPSVAVREAMQMAVPCVVTRVGGLREIIDHEQTGLHVNPGQPEEVAEAILRLIDDRDLRKRLGAAGRQKVHDEYSTDAIMQNFLRMCRHSASTSEGKTVDMDLTEESV
jgi:glycosyltransferase involved in cell wall biosynthesis